MTGLCKLAGCLCLLGLSAFCIQDAQGNTGDYLWVPCFTDDAVYKVNVLTHEVEATIPVESGPGGIAVGREYVYVTHRYTPNLARISKTDDVVVDYIDLSSVMAFGIGVAVDSFNNAYVVGRNRIGTYNYDLARIAKIDHSGTIVASTDMLNISGHGDRSGLYNAGIAVNRSGTEALLPWTRTWDAKGGITVLNTDDLSFTYYLIGVYTYGYRGPGVAYDEFGTGWTAGNRNGKNYLVSYLPDSSRAYFSIPISNYSGSFSGLAVDTSNNIWAGNTVGTLVKYDQAIPEFDDFSLGSPNGGIAIDRYGYIWIAKMSDNEMVKYDSDGIQVGDPVSVGLYPMGFGDMTGYECPGVWPASYPTAMLPIVGNYSRCSTECGYAFLEYACGYSIGCVYHPGWDMNLESNADAHSEVYAIADGDVVYSDHIGGVPQSWGALVTKHDFEGNTFYSQYGHCEQIFVSEGEPVKKGQKIALVGDVGSPGQYHLHWEIRMPEPDHPDPEYGAYWTSFIQSESNVATAYRDPELFVTTLNIDSREQTLHNGQNILAVFGPRNGDIHWYHEYNPGDLYDPAGNTAKNCFIQNYEGVALGHDYNGAVVYDALGGARRAYIVGWNEWNEWSSTGGPISPLGNPITNSYWTGSSWRQDFQTGFIDNGMTRAYGDEYALCAPGWSPTGWNPQYSYLFAQVYEENGGRPEVGKAATTVTEMRGAYEQEFKEGNLGPLKIIHDPEHDPQTYIVLTQPSDWYSSGPIANCEGPFENGYWWYDPFFDQSAWSPVELPLQGDNCENCNYCFRYWYRCDAIDKTVKVDFDADNGVKLYVNGLPAGQWGDQCTGDDCLNDAPWSCSNNLTVDPVDITDKLHEGNNLIAIQLTESAGDEYLDVDIIEAGISTLLPGVCCLTDGTCVAFGDSYSTADCQAAGGTVKSGRQFDCGEFSPCESPESKVDSDPLLFFQTALPVPEIPAEISFTLIDTLPRTIYYELPDSLGGVLYVSDFTGQLTLSAVLSADPDTVELVLTEYSFEAPSVLFNGMPTGINHVQLDLTDTSSIHGTYVYSTNQIDVTILSTITNDLFPGSDPIRAKSFIRGQFDQNTGVLMVGAQAYNIMPEQICDCFAGDPNSDGAVNVGDAVYLINYVFKGGPAPAPYQLCNGDSNGDCSCNVGDAVYLINYVFKSGPMPVDCGTWRDTCGEPLRK
ncbi:MAG: peptidoglycan DD-metalloendopeptidase family protein [FCB group bacterium]|nr:peptidoglycan DD-metalloendopeptidase family protein [FCB group bacterium]